MEQRGIRITGAGTAVVNQNLTVVDPSASGNAREWRGTSDVTDQRVVVYYVSGRGWVIASVDKLKIYYSEFNPTTEEADPWNVTYAVDASKGDIGEDNTPTLTSFDDPNIQITVGETTTTTDPSTGDEITTQTVMYYNAITNYRFSETNRTVTKTNYNTQTTQRYDTINLTLGKIYRFSFVKDFEKLGYSHDSDSPYHDVYCGVYRVDKILSYKDVLSSGIDVYNNLYAPIGVAKSVYDKDEPSFQNTMFYKLVDPRNEDIVIYMPLSFVNGVPDGSIARYDKLILGINLGVFSDLEMVTDLIMILTDLLEVKYGIKADGKQFPADKELVQINRYDDVYLTTDEYNTLNDARKDVADAAPKDNLLNKLFASEMNQLRLENDSLRSKIDAYETVIKNIKG